MSTPLDVSYEQWRAYWDKPWPYPNAHIVHALHRAGLLYKKTPMPADVRNALLELLQPNIDWSQTKVLWVVLENTLPGIVTKDRALYKHVYRSGIAHRIALQFALMLDAHDRKMNEKDQWRALRRWEPAIPRDLKIEDVPNATAALIRAWRGEFKAQQWLSLLALDKELKQTKTNRSLENYQDNDNLTAVLNFALHDQPLYATPLPVSLPDALSM